VIDSVAFVYHYIFLQIRPVMMHRTFLSVVVLIVLVTFSRSTAVEPGSVASPKLTKTDIEAMMKSLSNWGRWGRDDERGTLNLLTPEKRREAARLVTEGVTVSLAHNVLKNETASSPAFRHKMSLPKRGRGGRQLRR